MRFLPLFLVLLFFVGITFATTSTIAIEKVNEAVANAEDVLDMPGDAALLATQVSTQ